MNKFLLLALSLGLSSQVVMAQEAALQNTDEDSFQQTTTPVAAPAATQESVETVEVAPETPVEAVAAPTPAPIPEPAPVAVATPTPKAAVAAIPQAQPDPIDVNALYRTKPAPQVVRRPMTEAEKMKIMRARLEKQNEIMMKKQMERMRLKQEMEMSKRIQKSFDDSMKKLDETN